MLNIVIALAIAASPASPKPFGLAWGTPVTEAAEALEVRLSTIANENGHHATYYRDGSETRLYRGDFATFKDAEIAAMFLGGELAGFVIVIPRQGKAAISTTWLEATESIRKKYGKAEKYEGPSGCAPKTERNYKRLEFLERLCKDPQVLDEKIATKEWTPRAAWKFRDGTVAAVDLPAPRSSTDEWPRAVSIIFGSKKFMSLVNSSTTPPDF